MVRLKIPQMQKEISVEFGANVMRELMKAGVPVASSCNGEAVCGKCKVEANTETGQVLSKETLAESILKQKLNIASSLRLSCQLKATVDMVLRTSYW